MERVGTECGQCCTVCVRDELTPDFPQSEIAATIFYDLGGCLGEELGEDFCAFSCFICCTE